MIPTIILVDDDPNVRASIKRSLKDEPYRVITAESAEECWQLLSVAQPQVIIADLHMPSIDGANLLSQLYSIHPEIVRIMISGHFTLKIAIEAVNECQVFRCLEKPCPTPLLALTIRDALKYFETIKQTRKLKELVEMQASYIKNTDSENINEIEIYEPESSEYDLNKLIADAVEDVERFNKEFKIIFKGGKND